MKDIIVILIFLIVLVPAMIVISLLCLGLAIFQPKTKVAVIDMNDFKLLEVLKAESIEWN